MNVWEPQLHMPLTRHFIVSGGRSQINERHWSVSCAEINQLIVDVRVSPNRQMVNARRTTLIPLIFVHIQVCIYLHTSSYILVCVYVYVSSAPSRSIRIIPYAVTTAELSFSAARLFGCWDADWWNCCHNNKSNHQWDGIIKT